MASLNVWNVTTVVFIICQWFQYGCCLVCPRNHSVRKGNVAIRRIGASDLSRGLSRDLSRGLSRDLSISPLRDSSASVEYFGSTDVGTVPSANPSMAKTKNVSSAAQWHQERRRQMLQKYGDRILPLERDSCSFVLALCLLAVSNASLLTLAVLSGKFLQPLPILALAAFPGSMFSLWTLQILHDCLHGSLLPKGASGGGVAGAKNRKKLQERILFWGSMPSAFGYYLYLKYGHLTHHKSLGDAASASLRQLFQSDRKDFEDGDVLFVAHRMKLKGEVGPTFRWRGKKDITLSISKAGFNAWKYARPLRNSLLFASSFMYERLMLVINDLVVAITGRNYFFPNKPADFHQECATYCRCAMIFRISLFMLAGWKSILFLYLAETLWSIPPHPACAMFVTNHGSNIDPQSGQCVPSSSTYAGKWYSIFTLGTNYHCEHHDFPTIPLHRLGQLRNIAPEYYRTGSNDNLFRIMKQVFAKPDFYACMDAGVGLKNVQVSN